MEPCNSTNFTTIASATPFVIDSVGIIGTVVLLLIISQTLSLRNYSGLLLTVEQITCLLEQFFSIGVTIALGYPENTAKGILFALTQLVKNISVVVLMLINSNVYLAICEATAYRTLVTWKRVLLVLTVTLLVNIALGLFALFDTDYFVFDCDHGGIPYPNTTLARIWHPVLYVLQVTVALGFNAWFLFKTYRRHSTSGGASETDKKVKLAKFIFILAIIYTFTYICMYGLFYAKVFGTHIDGALLIFLNLNKVYVNLRLLFYLLLYKPLRETARSFLQWRSRRPHPDSTAARAYQTEVNSAIQARSAMPLVEIT